MSEVDQRQITAEFLVRCLEEDKIEGACVRLYSVRNSRSWRWVLNEKSYEQIYSLFKITQLVPGDLAAALSVKYFDQKSGDGTFMIHHLRSIFYSFSSLQRDAKEPRMPYMKKSYGLTAASMTSEAGHGANLPMSAAVSSICCQLSDILRLMQLGSTSIEALKVAVRVLLETCEDTFSMCAIFLNFIKPVWDLHNISPDPSHVESVREATYARLNSSFPKFVNAFRNLNHRFEI